MAPQIDMGMLTRMMTGSRTLSKSAARDRKMMTMAKKRRTTRSACMAAGG